MRALVICDSWFGNTEKIAVSILGGLGEGNEMLNIRKESVDPKSISEFDFLIVGSPTRGFRPTPELLKFISGLERSKIACASFDTRITLDSINSKALRFLVNTGGYAAKTIQNKLKRLGFKPVIAPEGFYVTGEEGPLKKGELKRAEEWGKSCLLKFQETN